MSINNIAIQILAETAYNEVIIEASLNESFEYITEGNFTDKIKTAFDAIIKFLKTCWSKIKGFFTKIFDFITKKNKDNGNKTEEEKVTEEAAKKATAKTSNNSKEKTSSNTTSTNDKALTNTDKSSSNGIVVQNNKESNKAKTSDNKYSSYSFDDFKRDIKSTMKKKINITETFKDFIHYEDEKYQFNLSVQASNIFYMFSSLYGSGNTKEKFDDFKHLSDGKMNGHNAYFQGRGKEDIDTWAADALQYSMKEMFANSSFKELSNKISAMTI